MMTTRKYPSYTLAQLEASVAAGRGTDEMIQEIEARKAGISKPRITPQIEAGTKIVIPFAGRW